MNDVMLGVPRVKQTKDECASASLLQILKYYGDNTTSLEEIAEYCGDNFKVRDWDYLLGCFALERGYNVRIHTRSLSVFDSTWFDLDISNLIEKLHQEKEHFLELQREFPGYEKLSDEVEFALNFLKMGGEINFSSFSMNLIYDYLRKGTPVVATFTGQLIYKLPREKAGVMDDIVGEPWKHTVVIDGCQTDRFYVTDPADFQDPPRYSINANTLLDGIIRYDSNLLLVSVNKFD